MEYEYCWYAILKLGMLSLMSKCAHGKECSDAATHSS